MNQDPFGPYISIAALRCVGKQNSCQSRTVINWKYVVLAMFARLLMWKRCQILTNGTFVVISLAAEIVSNPW